MINCPRVLHVVVAVGILLLLPHFGASAAAAPMEGRELIGRGINILGYDPIWEKHAYIRFKKRHFQEIKAAGFDTVRLNLFAFRHMNENFRLDPEWLRTLDRVIRDAMASGLRVILDEHDDAQGNLLMFRQQLTSFWDQVALRYASAPQSVMFEILNEPRGKLTPAVWSRLANDILARIRATNPARDVIVGPAEGYRYEALDKLDLPADDRHIIVTVHYYRPFEFTHQKAPWDPDFAKLPARNWGSEEDRQRLSSDFDHIQSWASAHQRPLFLGEFGAYDAAEMPSRAAYVSAVARQAESRGWGWAYWQFEPDFKLFDMACDCWVQELLKALIPSPTRSN